MKFCTPVLLAGTSLFAMASAAAAEEVKTPPQANLLSLTMGAAACQDESEAEIVVTARRREELLQDVPASISVVGGEQLDQFAIQSLDDIDQLVPGMDLASSTQGSLAITTFRGASYSAQTSTSNLVAFYLNDAPAEANNILQTTFDFGQIEVLRGTQGTLRGQSAPSGSIAVQTRRPDLEEFGGAANATFTGEDDGINLQGALNIPIVRDVLGFRIAGVVNENDLNGINSVNNPADPVSHTEGVRGTLRFEPTSVFSAQLMYQNLARESQSYAQVSGGPFGGNPYIAPDDRLAVAENYNVGDQVIDTWTLNADWDTGFGTLSYVGSLSLQDNLSFSWSDNANVNPGDVRGQGVSTFSENESHELRFASNEPVGGFMDYVVGVFYLDKGADVLIESPGAPLVVSSNTQPETSVFANVNFHLGDRTELSLGARYLEIENAVTVEVPSFSFTLADESIPDNATLWSASITHDLTDNLTVYASAGTAYRATSPGILSLSLDTVAVLTNPALLDLATLPPEESTNYEIGAKGNFLDGRVLVNVALFHQEFSNYIYLPPSAYYNGGGAAGGPFSARITTAADAIVDGIDVDATFRITDNWRLTAAASYADGRLDSAQIPTNDVDCDGDDDGIPDFTAPGAPTTVFTCASSGPISQGPDWSANLQSEYALPIATNMEGFVRGLYTYYPENNNGGGTFVTDSYGLLNLYAGVRAPDNGWEVMVFARNALDDDTVLTRSTNPIAYNPGSGTVTSNYFFTSVQQPQVFGVSLRTAFGSR